MPPQPIRLASTVVDLTGRFQLSTTVAASPSGASETIICTLALANFGDISVQSGILLNGWAAYTLGSTPSSCQLRVRQTNVSGTVVANTGAMTAGHTTAASLAADDVNGFDSGAGVSTYVLTLTVAGAGSASTVSACYLAATII